MRWGLVSTIKAPLAEIQRFAAWHLELGAAHLYLYLDDADPAQKAALAHPRITVHLTDAAWWARRNGRPDKHQLRQCRNARHANNTAQLDWLAHIDVDEFLLPQQPVAQTLAALPASCLCARSRPVEALAPSAENGPQVRPKTGLENGPQGGPQSGPQVGPKTRPETGPHTQPQTQADPDPDPPETLFKAFHLDHAARARAARACFPTFGQHLPGGFLSHVAGKVFFRARTKGLDIRIHNVFLDGAQNPGMVELPDLRLGHFHAADWRHFRSRFAFRLTHGSYRAELKPQARGAKALSLHELLSTVFDSGGEPGLRAFFDEVCTARPALCAQLQAEGLLYRQVMRLDALRAKHFSHANPTP